MSSSSQQSKIINIALIGFGAIVGYALAELTAPNEITNEAYISELELKIEELEKTLLADDSRLASITSTVKPEQRYKPISQVEAKDEEAKEESKIDMGEFNQTHKDLITRFVGDPRSFVEKSTDLLADKTNTHAVAVIAKGVFDMANVKEIVSDYDLETLYNSQPNSDLRRVTAQVMSMRGDNRLIEAHAATLAQQMDGASVDTKRRTLVELGRLRHVSAAHLIAPLLNDPSDEVKLDALLALKLTGNQSHVDLVRSLTNHPNESVKWLANDVVENLQVFSDVARTRVSRVDAASELPIN